MGKLSREQSPRWTGPREPKNSHATPTAYWPVGTFDSRTVEKMLGHSVYLEMRKHETAALKDRTELQWTGYATKADKGMIPVARATERQMATVTSKPMSRDRKQPWWVTGDRVLGHERKGGRRRPKSLSGESRAACASEMVSVAGICCCDGYTR